MKYKITITKVEEVEAKEDGQWTIVEKRPWTEKELGNAISSAYGDGKEFVASNPLKEVRDYAPARVVSKQIETEVLKQTVESLDLAAVIKAVNGL